VGAVLQRALLFVRTNPIHRHSKAEVERVLAARARVLMLPMVSTHEDAASFVEMVRGRAQVVLLLETREALDRASDLARVEGVDEVHVGLNDLAISLGLPNRWLALADERIVSAGRAVRAAGRRFGLGGIGRAEDDTLPIPSDLVYAESVRTGATAALVSRSFHVGDHDLACEVRRARARLGHWCERTPAELEAAHRRLVSLASAITCW
jgi:hypothetical protein